jgi:hypothetical protein
VIRNLILKGQTMTRFLPSLANHILPMIASLAVATTLLGATADAAFAQGEPAYRLTAERSLTGSQIANDVLWRCGPDGCTAKSASSRPAVVCAQAARSVGKLTSFTAKGAVFDAEALAKCNTKAR